MDTTIYLWTDREERTYALLRRHAGHWRVAWGHRDPPGGDNYLEQGHRETSVLEEAVRLMLEHVRSLSDDPRDIVRLAQDLRDALQEAQA
jgi:hypothetical protein